MKAENISAEKDCRRDSGESDREEKKTLNEGKKRKKREGSAERKSERSPEAVAAAAWVQLVRLHRDSQTEAIRSLVGISAPVCVYVCVCHVFLGQVGP